MFSSVSQLCKYLKKSGPSTNIAAVDHLWFFLLSHLLWNNYWAVMNETWLLCSPQCLHKKKKKKNGPSTNLAGSDFWGLRLSEISHFTWLLSHFFKGHWTDFFFIWSECCSPWLALQVLKTFRPLDKHGRRRLVVIQNPSIGLSKSLDCSYLSTELNILYEQ